MSDEWVRFELLDELPDPARGPGGGNTKKLYIEFAEVLRANPGKWAAWPGDYADPSVVRANIQRGSYPALSEGFTASVRNHICYVAYTGKSATFSLDARIRAAIREELRAALQEIGETP